MTIGIKLFFREDLGLNSHSHKGALDPCFIFVADGGDA